MAEPNIRNILTFAEAVSEAIDIIDEVREQVRVSPWMDQEAKKARLLRLVDVATRLEAEYLR